MLQQNHQCHRRDFYGNQNNPQTITQDLRPVLIRARIFSFFFWRSFPPDQTRSSVTNGPVLEWPVLVACLVNWTVDFEDEWLMRSLILNIFYTDNFAMTRLKCISQAFSSDSNSSGCSESFSISSWNTNLSSDGSVFDITEYLMFNPDPNSLLGHIFNPEMIFMKLWPANFEPHTCVRGWTQLCWTEADENFPGHKSFLD